MLALSDSHPHQHGCDAALVVAPVDPSAITGTFPSAQLGCEFLPVGLWDGPGLEGFTAMTVVNQVGCRRRLARRRGPQG
jgi:hypothetical protein